VGRAAKGGESWSFQENLLNHLLKEDPLEGIVKGEKLVDEPIRKGRARTPQGEFMERAL